MGELSKINRPTVGRNKIMITPVKMGWVDLPFLLGLATAFATSAFLVTVIVNTRKSLLKKVD